MKTYGDTNNDSGVASYEISSSSITICFRGARRSYTYSYGIAGQRHVEEMKRLAESGNGLNSYINRHVKTMYDR